MRRLAIVLLLAHGIACSSSEPAGGGRPGSGGSGGTGGSGGSWVVPGRIVGSVLLVEGGPAAGAEVTLDGKPVATVEPDGTYRIEGVGEPGTHTLSVALPPRWPESVTVDVAPASETIAPTVELRNVRRVGSGRYDVPGQSPPPRRG